MSEPSNAKHLSFWIDTTPRTDYPTLSGDVSVDVAVLGGGITGLTAAVLLKRLGKTVALVEMHKVAEGVSGHTTAKVTSQQGLIYGHLTEEHGEEKARLYARANEAAIDRIEAFVDEGKIDCDFRRLPAFTYTESSDMVGRIESEVEVARKLGLPASFTEDVPLPFRVEGAVRFEDQAQFHVRKYLLALAAEIPGDGSHLFEDTRALDVDDGDILEPLDEDLALAGGRVAEKLPHPYPKAHRHPSPRQVRKRPGVAAVDPARSLSAYRTAGLRAAQTTAYCQRVAVEGEGFHVQSVGDGVAVTVRIRVGHEFLRVRFGEILWRSHTFHLEFGRA
jgi:glycine/D-amino acid oxidase-like deaminating enzyme